MERPVIAVNPGDAAGIGPEILAKALKEIPEDFPSEILVVGDARVVRRGAEIAGIKFDINPIDSPEEAEFKTGAIQVLDSKNLSPDEVETGKVDPRCGRAMVEDIRKACELAGDGIVQCVVGGPHNKKAAHDAGIKFEGYPQFLQEFTGAHRTYFMFVVGDFRLTGVTHHVAYRDVPALITHDNVLHAIETLNQAVKEVGIERPRLIVTGLNPHAGEGGMFGDEEITGIAPAIETARSKGIEVEGPVPSDSLFYGAIENPKWDGYLAMYHEQTHLPVKTAAFDTAAGQIIGTPIFFTIVSHGTAFDIAGQGKANHRSLMQALRIAAEGAKVKKYGHR